MLCMVDSFFVYGLFFQYPSNTGYKEVHHFFLFFCSPGHVPNFISQKFALMFTVNVTMRGTTYKLVTLSLPMVVVVHPKQIAKVEGIITWDRAFSNVDRMPFVAPQVGPFPVARSSSASTPLLCACVCVCHVSTRDATKHCATPSRGVDLMLFICKRIRATTGY